MMSGVTLEPYWCTPASLNLRMDPPQRSTPPLEACGLLGFFFKWAVNGYFVCGWECGWLGRLFVVYSNSEYRWCLRGIDHSQPTSRACGCRAHLLLSTPSFQVANGQIWRPGERRTLNDLESALSLNCDWPRRDLVLYLVIRTLHH